MGPGIIHVPTSQKGETWLNNTQYSIATPEGPYLSNRVEVPVKTRLL